MNRCPTCQTTYPDDYKFCLEDATPLVAVAAPVEMAPIEMAPVAAGRTSTTTAPTARATDRPILPLLAAVSGLALLGAGGVALVIRRRPAAPSTGDAAGPSRRADEGKMGRRHLPNYAIKNGGTSPFGAQTEANPVANRGTFAALGAPTGATPGASGGGGCVLGSGPSRVGRRAAVRDGLHLAQSGDRVAMGWVTGPTHSHGNDDAAVVVTRSDGSLIEVVDPEVADETDGNERTLEEINLVAPRFNDAGQIETFIDRVSRGPQGGLGVSCGRLRTTFATFESNGLGGFETVARGTTHACRTVLTASPFVVGARARVGDGEYLRQEELTLTRADRSGEGAPRIVLEFDGRRAFGAADEVARVRAQSPVALSGVSLANGQSLVAFRYGENLYVARLDASLDLVGSLHRIQTLGDPGRPFLGTDGQTAVVVFPDRPATPHRRRHAPPVEPLHYTLFASRVPPDGAPEAPINLATEGDRLEDEFAASIQAFGDGTWLVGWSYGPREVHHDSAVIQRMYLRRFGSDLTPRGAPLWVNPSMSGSDGRFVTSGNHFTVAVMTGLSRDRQVDVWSGSCGD